MGSLNRDQYFQFIRGLAIIAVVLIHATGTAYGFLDNGYWSWNYYVSLMFRQVLNFAVATFVFVSGYFAVKATSSTENDLIYKKLKRILLPYLFWSLVAFVVFQTFARSSVRGLLYQFFTGQAVSIYYYIILLAQLIVLTRLLQRLQKSRMASCIIWMLSPLSLCFLYYFQLVRGTTIEFSLYALPFPIWIGFYYYGMYLGKNGLPDFIKIHKNIFALGYVLFLLSSMFEATWIFGVFGNLTLAISQIKFSSFLASFFFINFLLSVRDVQPIPWMIGRIGDYSFGIYLIHMFILPKIQELLTFFPVLFNIQPIFWLISAALTIAICVVIILASRKVIGTTNSQKYLGL